MPLQEWTKGNDTTPTVRANGVITTKIIRAVAARAAAVTVRCTLHPRSQVDLGWLTEPLEGITPFTVARLVRTPTTEEQEKGSPAMEP
jgi:hypothetical protein